MSRFTLPFESVFDANGNPGSGWKLAFYVSGTSTPVATYSNSGLSVANSNPVISNSSGRFSDIFLSPAVTYKAVLSNASNIVQWTADPISGAGVVAGDLAGLVNAAAITNTEAEQQAIVNKLEFLQLGTGAVSRSVGAELRDRVSVRQFGAVGDGVADDGVAVQAALTYAKTVHAALYFPAGEYLLPGVELVVDASMTIFGDGRGATTLVFQGSPAATVRTYHTWKAAYDGGDFSSSADAAVSCGFVVKFSQVYIRDMTIKAPWDATTNHPLPFSSATDFPTSNYDYAILVQRSDVSIERVQIVGPWGKAANLTSGAVKMDVSVPGGALEHCKVHDCEFYGRWGLVVEGAHGAPAGGDNYVDQAAADTRGVGGISDLCCVGSQFYDTVGVPSVRLTIGGTAGLRPRRFTASSGALYIDGQARNSAKRTQQITFLRCRFAAVDKYVYWINYVNRVGFIDCHSEYKSGYLLDDAVTVVSAADVSIRTTANARGICYIGGEKSGETDARTKIDTVNNLRLITEVGYDDPAAPSGVGDGRQLSGVQLGDRGTWTPALTASTPGTPTYSTQAGSWQRVGNLVFIQGRVTLSAITGMAGNLTITGLPYTCTNRYGSTGDYSLSFGLVSNVTMGTGGIGGYVDSNTKTAPLWKIASGGAVASLAVGDLAATSRFDFSGWYVTEEG